MKTTPDFKSESNTMKELPINQFIVGESAKVMSEFPDECIDLTVTSPPYDNLRKYDGFEFDFEAIAKQLYRITKHGGIVVWVVGDATIDGCETGSSFKQALGFMDAGFNLHDTMIYLKSPSYPSRNFDKRYSAAFEYMFVFSKNTPTTFNIIQDRKNRWATGSGFGNNSERQKDGKLKVRGMFKVKDVSARFNVWYYASGKGYSAKDDIAYNHPAIFPEQLAHDHIISWSNEGDVVLDPFAGSGTVAKASIATGRKWIGIDISERYIKEIAQPRINEYISKNILL